MDIIHNYKWISLVIALIVIGFAIELGVVERIDIAFAFLSIVIATFFATRSLYIANKSLEDADNSFYYLCLGVRNNG